MEFDISALNFLELTALKDRIDARMQTMRQESGPQLAERFEEEAAAVGLTIDDLVRATKKRKRGPVAQVASQLKKASKRPKKARCDRPAVTAEAVINCLG